jgi:hypothetical protein
MSSQRVPAMTNPERNRLAFLTSTQRVGVLRLGYGLSAVAALPGLSDEVARRLTSTRQAAPSPTGATGGTAVTRATGLSGLVSAFVVDSRGISTGSKRTRR